ncbi:hypothetical protein C5167_042739 [Papaver somniferum]|uniref:Uncharacterized protein n=1 Tax=Papaver somniferum TaxID=3469 RepID=A0A4Y7L7A7_PAPSO|nr:hypothetical protein C5167_042739 [Papaver somniferum]
MLRMENLDMVPKDQNVQRIPKKVDVLEGMHVMSVACGSCYSMVVVDRTNVGDKLDQLDVYDGKASEVGTADAKVKSPAPKKGGAKSSSIKRKKSEDLLESAEPKAKDPAPSTDGAKASSNKGKKLKDSPEFENEEDESDGGACENGSDAKKPAAGKGTGCGRGRPPSAEKKSMRLRGGGTGGKRGRARKS